MQGRRGFLKALAGVIAAAPVIAREVAAAPVIAPPPVEFVAHTFGTSCVMFSAPGTYMPGEFVVPQRFVFEAPSGGLYTGEDYK